MNLTNVLFQTWGWKNKYGTLGSCGTFFSLLCSSFPVWLTSCAMTVMNFGHFERSFKDADAAKGQALPFCPVSGQLEVCSWLLSSSDTSDLQICLVCCWDSCYKLSFPPFLFLLVFIFCCLENCHENGRNSVILYPSIENGFRLWLSHTFSSVHIYKIQPPLREK